MPRASARRRNARPRRPLRAALRGPGAPLRCRPAGFGPPAARSPLCSLGLAPLASGCRRLASPVARLRAPPAAPAPGPCGPRRVRPLALGVGLRAAAGFVPRPWAAAASPLRALGLSGAPCAAPFGPRCAGPGSSRRAGLGRRCRPCSPPPRPARVRFRKTKPIAPQGIPGLGPYDIPTRKGLI